MRTNANFWREQGNKDNIGGKQIFDLFHMTTFCPVLVGLYMITLWSWSYEINQLAQNRAWSYVNLLAQSRAWLYKPASTEQSAIIYKAASIELSVIKHWTESDLNINQRSTKQSMVIPEQIVIIYKPASAIQSMIIYEPRSDKRDLLAIKVKS